MCKEVEWRAIPGYEDYMVSTEGQVKSLKGKEARIVKKVYSGRANKNGKVKLYKNGSYITANVCTIMGKVFLGKKDGQITKHLNKDISDDRLENLYLVDLETVA